MKWALSIVTVCLCTLVANGQTTKKEINVGVANLATVRPILQSALSPAGKFVMLPQKGAVLVIDTPTGILSAERALSGAALPQPDVALDFEFVTGLPPRRQQITLAREVAFPTEYSAPTIIVGRGGGFTVIPSTPTKFEKRNVGVTSETTSTYNPDGSITLDVNTEVSEFEGFVNYGSAILPAGGLGRIPVNGAVGDPTFFAPFIDAGAIRFPIISTTRISTSIVIRPRVNLGQVELDVMPRLTIEPEVVEESDREAEEVDLRQFQTLIQIPNGEVGRVYGFAGADEEFNRRFLGAKEGDQGSTAIEVKAQLRKPSALAPEEAVSSPSSLEE